ncbi:testis-expressed protein 264 homolog isoform X2 [Pristis pectinata]|uniref:testis-expressed protein 264 homolog isoform X2 n=1 Tax=Pristis pectinata TaxID=685728 RepID=UPI00223D0411|nr:testis-expressed protein 264 homolog isoform X2 [Pristis pectinata]
MSELSLLALITLLLAFLLLLTLLALALYSGLLAKVSVRSGPPPIGALTVAYKYKQGPYREAAHLFTEITSIAPKLNCIGIYYDDPQQVPEEKLRYIAGSILSEGDEKPSEELVKHFEKFGFRIFSFPEVTHVVMTTFPFTTFLSLLLAMYRVYPVLNNYIKERKLCAHPCLEIYRGELIYYICPLARQSDFYVPELKEADKKQKEEAAGDACTDVADSFSDSSSVTYEAYTESRETSLTLPVTPGASKGEMEDSDRSESVASSSSFEEVELEMRGNGEQPNISLLAYPEGKKEPGQLTNTKRHLDIRRIEEE